MKSILSILALLFLIACNNKNQSENRPSMVGKWKPVDVSLSKMSAEEKKDVLDYAILEFTKDSNYTSTYKDGKQTGRFSFNPDDNKFRTFPESGSNDSAILSWENGLLRLTMSDGYIVLKKQ